MSLAKYKTIVRSLPIWLGFFIKEGTVKPSSNRQRWNQHLDWQPIPVLPVPLDENFLYHGVFCSKYQAILKDTASKDPTIVEYDQTNQRSRRAKMDRGCMSRRKTERSCDNMESIFSSWTDELKRYTVGDSQGFERIYRETYTRLRQHSLSVGDFQKYLCRSYAVEWESGVRYSSILKRSDMPEDETLTHLMLNRPIYEPFRQYHIKSFRQQNRSRSFIRNALRLRSFILS